MSPANAGFPDFTVCTPNLLSTFLRQFGKSLINTQYKKPDNSLPCRTLCLISNHWKVVRITVTVLLLQQWQSSIFFYILYHLFLFLKFNHQTSLQIVSYCTNHTQPNRTKPRLNNEFTSGVYFGFTIAYTELTRSKPRE